MPRGRRLPPSVDARAAAHAAAAGAATKVRSEAEVTASNLSAGEEVASGEAGSPKEVHRSMTLRAPTRWARLASPRDMGLYLPSSEIQSVATAPHSPEAAAARDETKAEVAVSVDRARACCGRA